ncbi:MAG: glutaredoxin family protein [Promethearchaeota archaeon]
MSEDLEYTEKPGEHDKHDVTIYALSTCGHCKRCLKFMDDNGIKFRYLYFDLLETEVRSSLREDLRKEYPDTRLMFPFIVIDGKYVIVGFMESQIKEALEME